MTPQTRLSRLALVAIVVGIASWGFQLLPPDDYHPSRPLYVLACMSLAGFGYATLRNGSRFFASVALISLCIFTFGLFITLLM